MLRSCILIWPRFRHCVIISRGILFRCTYNGMHHDIAQLYIVLNFSSTFAISFLSFSFVIFEFSKFTLSVFVPRSEYTKVQTLWQHQRIDVVIIIPGGVHYYFHLLVKCRNGTNSRKINLSMLLANVKNEGPANGITTKMELINRFSLRFMNISRVPHLIGSHFHFVRNIQVNAQMTKTMDD